MDFNETFDFKRKIYRWKKREAFNAGDVFEKTIGLFWSKSFPKFSSWVLPLLDVIHCCKLSLYPISRKTNEPNLRKSQKNPPSFCPEFSPFGPNLGPKFFFRRFYLYQMLDIVASYHCMQFEGKLKNQTWENGEKKPSFGSNFGPSRPNSLLQFSFIFFFKNLASSVFRYHNPVIQCLIIQFWDKREWFHRTLFD